jgi:signal transduction histidine kinase
MSRRGHRGIRARLLASNAIVMLIALAVVTIVSNVIIRHALDRNATHLVRARAAAGLATLRTTDDRITVVESPNDAAIDVQIWVYDRAGTVESPKPSTALIDREARALAGGPVKTVDIGETRLHSVPVMRNGRRVGTLVAGVDLEPYREGTRTALLASIGVAVVLFALVMLASRSILRRALEPVARMTRAAAEWSEHSLDRRFARGEPYDELSSLAATLDTLLTRVGNSLRNEQRFSSEMSHELRTPLARIHAEVELALKRERTPAEQRAALVAIGRSAAQMTRTVEALVAIARFEGAAAHGTSDAREVVEHAIEANRPARGDQGIDPQLDIPRLPVRLGADAEVVERILAPLIENACRHASSRVTVAVAREGTTAVITVSDDGDGVAAADLERIFQPGVRIDPPAGERTAGLGLALARRLAAAAGGSILAAAGPGGRFVVRLPLA